MLFPRVPVTNMRYVLENYFDITRDLIKDIRKNSISRWIVISRCGVPYVITENIALIYDADREFDRLKDKSCPSAFAVTDTTVVDTTSQRAACAAASEDTDEVEHDDRIYKKGIRHVKFFKGS